MACQKLDVGYFSQIGAFHQNEIVAFLHAYHFSRPGEVFFQNMSISKNEIVACWHVGHVCSVRSPLGGTFFQDMSISKNEIVACWRLYVCPTCISRARFFAFAASEWRDFSWDPTGVRFSRRDALVGGHSDFQHVISKG